MSREFLHDLWPPIFCRYFFIRQNCPQRHPKPLKRVPKGCPLDTIFGCFGATGGNVNTMVSFRRNYHLEGWSGPQRPLMQHFAHSVFQRASPNDFFSICCRFGLGGKSWERSYEGPTNHFSGYFFNLIPLGAPGEPRVSKTPPKPQNDSKDDSKTTAEGAKTTSQILAK